MIKEIELEKYRGFEKYRVGGLTRVNLIVGRNNCGKTSILEAIQLFVSGGDPSVLAKIAWQRGEFVLVREDQDAPGGRGTIPDISHFFHKRNFRPGSYFRILADGQPDPLIIRIDLPEKGGQQPLFEENGVINPGYAVFFDGATHPRANQVDTFSVTDAGGFLWELNFRFRRLPDSMAHPLPIVHFISPNSLEPRLMSDMWDRVLLDGREDSVIKAMRILEEDLTDIFFLSGGSLRVGGRIGVLLGFKGAQRRIPMGSFGEGMRRLLALSLTLTQTAGGVLLADEIDTGLHWSIMGDMWRLVVSAALESNTQVFATTHSLDCLRGLAWLCENHPDLGEHVSVHKIDPGLEDAVGFDASQIQVAIEQEIEVR